MIDTMGLIVEILFEVIEEIHDLAINLFYGLVFILLLATLPVWIVPFLIWKSRRDE